jgi:nitrogen fixation protein FixH
MTATTEERPFTGWHMLAVIVAFFGVIIAVNVGMAVIASTSWTGLVVSNSYVASQEFEEKRIAHEAQRDAGWTPHLVYDEGAVRLRVVDASGRAVALGEVSILLNRPVGGHDDQTIALLPAEEGGYEGTAVLATGVWDATAIAPSTPLGPFELHARIRVQEGGQ